MTTGKTSSFAAGEGNQLGPTWSPDGREIAYVDESARNRAVIRVVGSDGASPRGISGVAAWTYPQWSPDGRHVVAADLAPGGVPALVILDATGMEPARRIDLPDARGVGRADLPAWQRLAP